MLPKRKADYNFYLSLLAYHAWILSSTTRNTKNGDVFTKIRQTDYDTAQQRRCDKNVRRSQSLDLIMTWFVV